MVLQAAPPQEVQHQAEYFNVSIDNVRYPAIQVTPINLARYQGKNTIGDYTRDSDDLQSAMILYSFRGGGQKLDAIEGADDERYWDSTLNTEYPGQLCLQDKKYRYAGPNAVRAVPVGDYNAYFYAAFDKSLMRWNAAGKSWDAASAGDLTAQPIAKAFEYAGKVYIPLGSSGFDVFDGTTIVNSTAVEPVAFAIWDAKLLALTVDGRLCTLPDPAGAWDIPAAYSIMTLPTDHRPRGMELYYNQAGEPTIHIITDRRVYAYDPTIPRLMPTQLIFPPHPDNAQGFSAWRSESLFVSAGVGVYEYNGSVVSAVGLDRNDGLPAAYRGNIVDLTPEHNGLLALVAGTDIGAGDPAVELYAEEGVYYDDPLEVNQPSTESCMWKYTTGGWHNVWTSRGVTGIPTWTTISTADNDYRMWWGFNGDMWTQKLRRQFQTPQQGAVAGIDEFEADGYLITPQYDMSMRGFLKLGSHFEVYLKDALGTGDPTGVVHVSYRTNFKTSWQSAGEASTPGRTVLPLPVDPVNETYEGVPFIWIQFRFDLEQTPGVITNTPMVDSFVLKYTKIPLSGRSWTIRMPLTNQRWGKYTSSTLRRKLNDLTATPRFVPFVHKDERTRVLVAQITGEEATGKVEFGMMVVSLLEVKLPESSASSAYGTPLGGD